MPKQKQTKPDKIMAILDTEETLANAIRRNANNIPVLAIEEVEIHKNDSALYDEVLAHRLGLIPLKDIRKINDKKSCTCKGKGCKKCQLQLSLKAKGPCTVYSGDIKGDVEVVYDKMPIVILDKEQELEMLCFAELGKGKDHAKFSPGLVYYRNMSEIKIKDKQNAQEIIKKLGESIISKGEIIKCVEDADYIESLPESGDILEVNSGKELVFFIESWGQMPAKQIFSEAVKVLNKDLKEVVKAIK